jgi:hypothetical protein
MPSRLPRPAAGPSGSGLVAAGLTATTTPAAASGPPDITDITDITGTGGAALRHHRASRATACLATCTQSR